MPTGTGRIYVTLSVRLTPGGCQKPGFEMRSSTKLVQESKIAEAQPPCKLLYRLQWTGCTVNLKVILGCGGEVEYVTMDKYGEISFIQF